MRTVDHSSVQIAEFGAIAFGTAQFIACVGAVFFVVATFRLGDAHAVLAFEFVVRAVAVHFVLVVAAVVVLVTAFRHGNAHAVATGEIAGPKKWS